MLRETKEAVVAVVYSWCNIVNGRFLNLFILTQSMLIVETACRRYMIAHSHRAHKTTVLPEPEIHRVDLESRSTLRLL